MELLNTTKGYIGNFTADANGNGTISLTTDEWNIGSGDPMKRYLGKGLIVHQGTDDFTSQPSGNAGARVAVCHHKINRLQ
jgi:Cu-Zn family superoxide dismutase